VLLGTDTPVKNNPVFIVTCSFYYTTKLLINMKNVQKIWTKAEQKTAKLTLVMEWKKNKESLVSVPLIIRPSKLSSRHLNQLIKIIDEYGKSK
jgi:hypothetical protein